MPEEESDEEDLTLKGLWVSLPEGNTKVSQAPRENSNETYPCRRAGPLLFEAKGPVLTPVRGS